MMPKNMGKNMYFKGVTKAKLQYYDAQKIQIINEFLLK